MTDSNLDENDAIGYPDPNSVRTEIQGCEPPDREATAIDMEERWRRLETDRYETAKSQDALIVHADDPGIGKTTNIARGAAQHGDPFVLYLPTHQNCHEFVTIDWKGREFGVPLSQLEPVEASDDTEQAVSDWHYWLER
jgi:hypothetical protein